MHKLDKAEKSRGAFQIILALTSDTNFAWVAICRIEELLSRNMNGEEHSQNNFWPIEKTSYPGTTSTNFVVGKWPKKQVMIY